MSHHVPSRFRYPAGEDTLLVSLRDLYDAVTRGLYGGRTDPLTGLPYRLQDTMPEAVLTQCRHWVNYPQVASSEIPCYSKSPMCRYVDQLCSPQQRPDQHSLQLPAVPSCRAMHYQVVLLLSLCEV
jgi:hypothetical protein